MNDTSKIALLHDKKGSSTEQYFTLGEHCFRIRGFYWKGKPTLRRLRRFSPQIAGAQPHLIKGAVLPCPAVSGGRLRIALLEQHLNSNFPQWPQKTILINCSKPGGIAAAHLLAKESDLLQLTGEYAALAAQQLFQKFGCLPRSNGEIWPLSRLLPEGVETAGQKIPLWLGEAMLCSIAGTADISLDKLAELAAIYGLTPYPLDSK